MIEILNTFLQSKMILGPEVLIAFMIEILNIVSQSEMILGPKVWMS